MIDTPPFPELRAGNLGVRVAEQLLARAPASVGAMVPANTGTESVEAAIKISRAATGRQRVLFADHGFHGLTLGSLSANGNDEFRAGFGPLMPEVYHLPFHNPYRNSVSDCISAARDLLPSTSLSTRSM